MLGSSKLPLRPLRALRRCLGECWEPNEEATAAHAERERIPRPTLDRSTATLPLDDLGPLMIPIRSLERLVSSGDVTNTWVSAIQSWRENRGVWPGGGEQSVPD